MTVFDCVFCNPQEEMRERVEEYKEVKAAEERERHLVEEVKRRVEMEEKQRVAKVLVGKLKDRVRLAARELLLLRFSF